VVIVALLLGALFGGLASENPVGAFMGAAIGWLAWRQMQLGQRIANLEERLKTRGPVQAPVQAPAPAAALAPQPARTPPPDLERLREPLDADDSRSR